MNINFIYFEGRLERILYPPRASMCAQLDIFRLGDILCLENRIMHKKVYIDRYYNRCLILKTCKLNSIQTINLGKINISKYLQWT